MLCKKNIKRACSWAVFIFSMNFELNKTVFIWWMWSERSFRAQHWSMFLLTVNVSCYIVPERTPQVHTPAEPTDRGMISAPVACINTVYTTNIRTITDVQLHTCRTTQQDSNGKKVGYQNKRFRFRDSEEGNKKICQLNVKEVNDFGSTCNQCPL